MKHYVLLKFDPNYYCEDVFNYARKVFSDISNTLEDIQNVNIYKNCVNRDSNMDIMIEMDFKNKNALTSYLEHDLHKDFVDVVDKHLILRVSFDCEEIKY
ncbi:MAG TPA: Dabb family protein [Bacillota bacterium]|nr:Dabb family protein [Bacillota bacterium]HOR86374.1 Dabb family protein [Bacillota bacterium]HPL53910.1 Dabb family protein [Bacillota bacterium]